ncbi:MAG: hypothetical protein PWP03_791 [Candidatus Woesearchaeota archaeon]|nr:hypothetical protein [Candidatus Woesearchaeota archaeon]
MKKGMAFQTLVAFILMIVVVLIVAMIFYRGAHSASQTSENKCEKCVASENECSLDEVPVRGFGCYETEYCCVKQNI